MLKRLCKNLFFSCLIIVGACKTSGGGGNQKGETPNPEVSSEEACKKEGKAWEDGKCMSPQELLVHQCEKSENRWSDTKGCLAKDVYKCEIEEKKIWLASHKQCLSSHELGQHNCKLTDGLWIDHDCKVGEAKEEYECHHFAKKIWNSKHHLKCASKEEREEYDCNLPGSGAFWYDNGTGRMGCHAIAKDQNECSKIRDSQWRKSNLDSKDHCVLKGDLVTWECKHIDLGHWVDNVDPSAPGKFECLSGNVWGKHECEKLRGGGWEWTTSNTCVQITAEQICLAKGWHWDITKPNKNCYDDETLCTDLKGRFWRPDAPTVMPATFTKTCLRKDEEQEYSCRKSFIDLGKPLGHVWKNPATKNCYTVDEWDEKSCVDTGTSADPKHFVRGAMPKECMSADAFKQHGCEKNQEIYHSTHGCIDPFTVMRADCKGGHFPATNGPWLFVKAIDPKTNIEGNACLNALGAAKANCKIIDPNYVHYMVTDSSGKKEHRCGMPADECAGRGGDEYWDGTVCMDLRTCARAGKFWMKPLGGSTIQCIDFHAADAFCKDIDPSLIAYQNGHQCLPSEAAAQTKCGTTLKYNVHTGKCT